MKRFEKLERARAAEPAREPDEAAAKRFEAIEPVAPKAASVQLELHDRYTEKVEDARREREARANEQLARLEAEAIAREQRHDPDHVLDRLARVTAIGPLARLGPVTRLWLVGAVVIVLWIALWR